jgi:hypothetical protein
MAAKFEMKKCFNLRAFMLIDPNKNNIQLKFYKIWSTH